LLAAFAGYDQANAADDLFAEVKEVMAVANFEHAGGFDFFHAYVAEGLGKEFIGVGFQHAHRLPNAVVKSGRQPAVGPVSSVKVFRSGFVILKKTSPHIVEGVGVHGSPGVVGDECADRAVFVEDADFGDEVFGSAV
jgi:ribosomal protein S5